MTDVVQQQTDQLLIWLKSIDHGLQLLHYDIVVTGVAIFAVLLVIAFKRRRP